VITNVSLKHAVGDYGESGNKENTPSGCWLGLKDYNKTSWAMFRQDDRVFHAMKGKDDYYPSLANIIHCSNPRTAYPKGTIITFIQDSLS